MAGVVVGVQPAHPADILVIPGVHPLLSGALRAPGYEITSNKRIVKASAVLIGQTEIEEPTVINTVVDGALYSLAVAKATSANVDFSENNEFHDNHLTLAGTATESLVVSVSQNTTVSNNTLISTGNAIRSGAQSKVGGEPKDFWGACNLKPTRYCLANDDCNIPGFDGVQNDTCDGEQTIPVHWIGDNLKILNNTILVREKNGIQWSSLNTTVSGNKITGPSSGEGILVIGKYALETSVVEANSVSKFTTALALVHRLVDLAATSYSARISRNDFTDYVVGVRTRDNTKMGDMNPYTLDTDLSKFGIGNFWGTGCDTGLAQDKVLNPDNSKNLIVKDSRPYGSSIASTLLVQPSGTVVNRPGFTPPAPCSLPNLTVRLKLEHPDPTRLRLFNLLIDGVVVRSDMNGGTVGPLALPSGTHNIGQSGGTGTNISNFYIVFGPDCAAMNGTISLGLGESRTCTITNYDNFGGCQLSEKCCEPGTGTEKCKTCYSANQQCP